MKQRVRTFFAAPTTPLLFVAVAMLVGSLLLNFGVQGVQDTLEQTVCESVPVPLGDRVAILRVDDVQGWAWGHTTRLMIDDAIARGAVLTLGVIPKHLDTDPQLVSFLRGHLCNLEIALHGWDHALQEDGVSPEFAHMDKRAAEHRLRRGAKVLTEQFDTAIETWIPPQNVHSSGTEAAATTVGLVRFSTEGDAQWDYDATTWDYDTNELVTPQDTIAACEESVVETGVCIIMLHPQNYAIGDEHNDELYEDYYLTLLDRLQAEGYTFARFRDVDTE